MPLPGDGKRLTGSRDASSAPVRRCPARELSEKEQVLRTDLLDSAHLLPHSPEAPGLARWRVRSALEGADAGSECLDSALLVVSELVTNAVRHARPPVTLRLSWVRNRPRGPVLRIEVTDAGPEWGTRTDSAGPRPEESGRGKELIAALSVRQGSRAVADGMARWAEVEAPGGDGAR
ncbi:ATP-binding protein [Streptomyces sp. F63]|uniref:ATP-binding protein n=1 Tax=Streptomyces sp. F63 TaxID=2824887 RepID=UPI001B386C17|nr:ATP-binding protein [Streptomyces sp. F63]